MRWIISLLFMLMGPVTALAQQQAPPPAGNFWYDNTASPPLWRPASTAYPFPISGSFTANLNGFAPSLSYATCSSTGSSCASTAIPTNTGSVVLFNSGTTAVSCTVASGAATALTNEIQIPASSGIALATVYGATTYDHFACIDQTGSATNVVVASGGSGLPTGWGGGGAGGSSTITNWGSGSNTLGAMANYGTSPGAVLVPGVNAFVTNTNANGSAVSANSSPVVIASDQAAIPVTPSAGANWGIGATGSAVPANAQYIGIISGGNLTGWTGAVTVASGGIASGAIASGAIVDGADVSEGATADAAATAGSTGSVQAKLRLMTSQLATIGTNTGAPPPLGTSGGWTPLALTAITNSSQTVKASAGQLGYVLCDNNNAAWTYLQFFNATSPSIGTNVGFIPIAPNLSGGMTLSLVGLQFSNSIKVAATTTPTGSTAPATSTVNCSFGYN